MNATTTGSAVADDAVFIDACRCSCCHLNLDLWNVFANHKLWNRMWNAKMPVYLYSLQIFFALVEQNTNEKKQNKTKKKNL